MADQILVRHATTAWTGLRYCGRSDPPLDRAGRAAAARVAAELAPTLGPGTRIVSSPSRRARETARSIAGAAGIAAVEFDARWCEADFGIAEGLTFDALVRIAPDLAQRLADGETRVDWPDGETADALAGRVAAAWDDVLRDGGEIIVVSHAGPLRIVVGLATGVSTDAIEPPAPGAVIRVAGIAAT